MWGILVKAVLWIRTLSSKIRNIMELATHQITEYIVISCASTINTLKMSDGKKVEKLHHFCFFFPFYSIFHICVFSFPWAFLYMFWEVVTGQDYVKYGCFNILRKSYAHFTLCHILLRHTIPKDQFFNFALFL